MVEAEYDDFLCFSGLTPQQLEVRTLDQPDSPLGDFTDITGVFIGGSPFTITAPIDEHWQPAISQRLAHFAAAATKHRHFPILATCYGASLFAHYLGGKVGTQYAEAPGITRITLTEAAAGDPLCTDLPQQFLGFAGHKDSVLALPLGATLLAGGPQCPVQFYRMGDNVWATQFHPEMDGERITRRLSFYANSGYCDPAELQHVYAALRGHDTSTSNTIVRRFVDYAIAQQHQRSSSPADA